MFNPFSKNETQLNLLDAKIADLYSELAGYDANTEDHDKIVDQIIKLEKLRNDINSGSWKPSPDAILAAVVSLGGIAMIIHAEHLGAITSKALSFVRKATN